jgi:carboxypeptidase family protein
MSWIRSICVFLVALSSVAFAQNATSVIFGTVTDSSGSAVPNVPVTATAAATGVSTRVTTNESGNYVLPNLSPGTYTVSCEAPGFRKAEVSNVLVEVNQRGRVDLPMQV